MSLHVARRLQKIHHSFSLQLIQLLFGLDFRKNQFYTHLILL